MAPRPPVLALCGLGLHYPHQATLEVLKALSSCDVVFSNLAGVEAMEFLGLFCDDVRAVSYEIQPDEARWAKAILSELRPGRTTAFVTRGHPIVSGHLAQALVAGAKARRARVVAYGAVSSIDAILALAADQGAADWEGLHVYEARLVAEGRVRLDPRIPTILNPRVMPGREHLQGPLAAGLLRALKRAYPPKHRFFLFGPRYEVRHLEPVLLTELPERLARMNRLVFSSTIIVAPPAKRL